MYKFKGALIALVSLFILSGCGGGGGGTQTQSSPLTASNLSATTVRSSPSPSPQPSPSVIANFNPLGTSTSDVPFPNSLASSATGQNAVPNPTNNSVITGVNTIKGFSTAGTINIPFSGLIDPATVTSNSVIVFDVANNVPLPTTLTVTTDAVGGNSYITIAPFVPLPANSVIDVFVTDSVKDSKGVSTGKSLFITAVSSVNPVPDATIEALRKVWAPMFATAQSIGLSRSSLVQIFQFRTQAIGSVLSSMKTNLQSVSPTATTSVVAPGVAGVNAFYAANNISAVPHANIGLVVVGTISSPNFLVNPPTQGITFNANGVPVQQGTGNVPFIATVPLNAKGPVPVIIFQHGITRSKSDMLAIADSAAAAGFGMIGIDAVLHGQRAVTGQASGTGFVNIAQPTLTRDWFYQTYNDMYSETKLIQLGNTNFLGTGPVFATGNVAFVGQSLGGIMGGVYVATEPKAAVGVLNVAGGRLAYLFTNSATFGPQVLAGLAAQGIKPNTMDFADFLSLVQTCLDDIDPFNYGPGLVSGKFTSGTTHQALIQEMINDQVVPNSATSDLAVAINTVQVDAVQPITGLTQVKSPFSGTAIFQFTGGQHGFLLDPTQGSAALTAAGQKQALTYDATGLAGVAQVINTVGKAAEAVVGIPQTFDVDGFITY